MNTMSDYRAPLQDMLFLLREVAPLGDIARLPGCEEMSLDLAKAILYALASAGFSDSRPRPPKCCLAACTPRRWRGSSTVAPALAQPCCGGQHRLDARRQ